MNIFSLPSRQVLGLAKFRLKWKLTFVTIFFKCFLNNMVQTVNEKTRKSDYFHLSLALALILPVIFVSLGQLKSLPPPENDVPGVMESLFGE